MPMSIKELRESEGYRPTNRGRKGPSVTSTFGNLLRENAGMAYTAEEAMEALNELGFEDVKDVTQLETAARTYNGNDFRGRHPEVTGNIVLAWYNDERIFYYEAPSK